MRGLSEERIAPDLTNAALSYSRQDIAVFPLHSINNDGVCTCGGPIVNPNCSPGKHPRTPHGFHNANTDKATIRKWWGKWPDANIATPTGPESGVWVLDVDPRHGGDSSLEKIEDEYGKLGARRIVRTGGGGLQLYFKHPGFKIKSANNALGDAYPGLDVKGDGGYVILPPSTHASGGRYETVQNEKPGPAPDWLLRLLREPQKPSHKAVTHQEGRSNTPSSITLDGPSIVEGTRNAALTSIAGKLHDGTRTVADLVEGLLAINNARCPSPLSREEVEKIAESISRYEPCRTAKDQPPPRVIGVLGDLLDRWWRTDWSGPGGPSERDVELTLILLGLRFGQNMPDNAAVKGVNVSVSYTQLAELARMGKGTSHRAVTRLKIKGRVRSGGNGPNRWLDATAGIILLAPDTPRKVEQPSTTSASSTGGVGSVPLCAHPTAPRGKYSAPGLKRKATKRSIAAVDYLEKAGGWLHEEALASKLGMKRSRDARRRYLEPLGEQGVVESSGKEWRLTENWRFALEKVFAEEQDLERALYGGKTADERQKERNQRDRERYRKRYDVIPDKAPTRGEMKERRETFPERRRKAVEEGLVRLFADKPEYRGRRVGQITCSLIAGGYLLDDFPRGNYGLPKDAEIETILDGIRAA